MVKDPGFARCFAANSIKVALRTYNNRGLAAPGDQMFRCTRLGVGFMRMELPRSGPNALSDASLRGSGTHYDDGMSTVHCNFYKWVQCQPGAKGQLACKAHKEASCAKVCKMVKYEPSTTCSTAACKPSYCSLLTAYS